MAINSPQLHGGTRYYAREALGQTLTGSLPGKSSHVESYHKKTLDGRLFEFHSFTL